MIPNTIPIFVCTEPVDMRRSFDGLALAVQQMLHEDPRSGGLYVFANRRLNRLKVLWFEKNGYCLLYKRLHRAAFEFPSRRGTDAGIRIDAATLGRILQGVARTRAHAA